MMPASYRNIICSSHQLPCINRTGALAFFHLLPMHSFFILENIRKLTVFGCFQGVGKGCIGNKWIKCVGLRPTTLLKKRLWLRCFPVNFAKFLGTSFLTKHSVGCFCLFYHDHYHKELANFFFSVSVFFWRQLFSIMVRT